MRGGLGTLLTASLHCLGEGFSLSGECLLLNLRVQLGGYTVEHLGCCGIGGGGGQHLGCGAFSEDDCAIGFTLPDLLFSLFTGGSLLQFKGLNALVFERLFKLADGHLGTRDRDGQVLCLHSLGGPGKGEDNNRNDQGCQQGGADDLNPGGAFGGCRGHRFRGDCSVGFVVHDNLQTKCLFRLRDRTLPSILIASKQNSYFVCNVTKRIGIVFMLSGSLTP